MDSFNDVAFVSPGSGMSSHMQDRKASLLIWDFSDTEQATKSIKALSVQADRASSWLTNYARAVVSKSAAAHHRARRGARGDVFDYATVLEGLAHEVVHSPEGFSIITRSAIKMTDQFVAASKLLDDAEQLFDKQVKKFNESSDKAISTAKQRVSQLNDYNNRLATALSNLNKTLGDEKMFRALESAEKLVTALTLLDKLESNGSLKRVMDALGSGT